MNNLPDPTTIDPRKMRFKGDKDAVQDVLRFHGTLFVAYCSNNSGSVRTIRYDTDEYFWRAIELIEDEQEYLYFKRDGAVHRSPRTGTGQTPVYGKWVTNRFNYLREQYLQHSLCQQITKEEADRALIDSIEIPEGYTRWYGGKNPAPGVKVANILRSGDHTHVDKSEEFGWDHSGWGCDIIAYKAVEEREPMTRENCPLDAWWRLKGHGWFKIEIEHLPTVSMRDMRRSYKELESIPYTLDQGKTWQRWDGEEVE